MPSLIPEILFQIARKIVEDGDQNAVMRFAFSGKEPLNALMNVFRSITAIKLYDGHYDIGWGEKYIPFYHSGILIPHARALMACIGGCVTNLSLQCGNQSSLVFYRPILDRIMAAKQLTSLTFPRCANQKETCKFIRAIAPTVQDFAINAFLLADYVRDCFDLQNLTIFNNNAGSFFQHCPKTSSITFMNFNGRSTIQDFHDGYSDFFSEFKKYASPFLSSVKELKFFDISGNVSKFPLYSSLKEYMHTFSSLEHLHFQMKNKAPIHYINLFRIDTDIRLCKHMISSSKVVPSKVTYIVEKSLKMPEIDHFKLIFEDFEFADVDTVPDFYCFRKMINSAEIKMCLLEIQLAKL